MSASFPLLSQRRRPVLVLLLTVVLFGGSAAAQSLQTLPPSPGVVREGGARVALVLGNADYEGERHDLTNPANDAQDVAEALRRVGFTVVHGTDLSRDEMQQAIDRFARETADAEVALLFYAGHGAEFYGENYLLPTDAVGLEEAERVVEVAVPLSLVLAALDRAPMRVIVLDACRNNPFAVVQSRSEVLGEQPVNMGGGWARLPSGTSGTLVFYATAAGAVAADAYGEGSRNAPFTAALLEEIEVAGLEAAELMRRLTERVREATNFHQNPYWEGSYTQSFYFVPPIGGVPRFEVEAPAADLEQWASDGREAYRQGDFERARALLLRAASAGHAEAQYYLGAMHLKGDGGPENPSEAADWFELAATQGHAKAQYFLGGLYHGGFGRPRDEQRAVDLYERAATQGLDVAQFRLGIVYEAGRGRPESVSEAVRWYRLAADKGHTDAFAALRRLADAGSPAALAALSGAGL